MIAYSSRPPAATLLVGLLLLLALLALTVGWLPAGADDGTVVATIDQAARDEGVSPSLLRCLAWYESSDRPWVVSPTNDAGLFQFHLYRDGSSLMGETPWANWSPFNAWASAHATGWLIKRGYLHRWTTWRLCVTR